MLASSRQFRTPEMLFKETLDLQDEGCDFLAAFPLRVVMCSYLRQIEIFPPGVRQFKTREVKFTGLRKFLKLQD